MTETRATYETGASPVAKPHGSSGHRRQGRNHPLRADPRLRVAVADFPGCRPVRVSRQEIDSWEGRFEYWDARTEVAMVAEDVTTYHEYPSQRLARLTEIIAASRGSPIDTVGCADLLLRDQHGHKARIMQADQTVYLHPHRDRPQGPAMEVDQKLPDVVLEVDHTTDAYRKKVELYEAWGFPELWVEVPDARSPSRPKSKVPGLRIHVLGAAGCFEERTASAAFPGWTATAIHRALNENKLSEETVATLRRIGRALGEREGTTQDDSPFLRAERLDAQRALLGELAKARLDASDAQRLQLLLAGVDDPDVLARVGRGLADGASGAELASMLADLGFVEACQQSIFRDRCRQPGRRPDVDAVFRANDRSLA